MGDPRRTLGGGGGSTRRRTDGKSVFGPQHAPAVRRRPSTAHYGRRLSARTPPAFVPFFKTSLRQFENRTSVEHIQVRVLAYRRTEAVFYRIPSEKSKRKQTPSEFLEYPHEHYSFWYHFPSLTFEQKTKVIKNVEKPRLKLLFSDTICRLDAQTFVVSIGCIGSYVIRKSIA